MGAGGDQLLMGTRESGAAILAHGAAVLRLVRKPGLTASSDLHRTHVFAKTFPNAML